MKSKQQFSVINLSQQPKLYPDTGIVYSTSDVLPFGSDNLFPQALALLLRTSPNHRGIINSKTNYFCGSGIVSSDEKIQLPIITKANDEENLIQVAEKCFFDFNSFGNAYIEIITDNKNSFIWFNHIDATKVRKVREDFDKGEIDQIITHPNWPSDIGKSDNRREYLNLYPNWEVVKNEYGIKVKRCVYHFKDYEPEFTEYGIPCYIAGKDAASIDFKTNKWNLSRLENSFRVSGILVVPVADETEGSKVLKNIESSKIGEGNNAKLLTIAKTRARENEKADTTQLIETKQDDDGSWINLHSQAISDLIVSHGWYRSLSGIADNTGFDTQRILNEYSVALNTTILKTQAKFTDFVNKIFIELQNKECLIKFVNKAPLEDYSYHYIWEVRKLKGLPYNENDPAQQVLITPTAPKIKA